MKNGSILTFVVVALVATGCAGTTSKPTVASPPASDSKLVASSNAQVDSANRTAHLKDDSMPAVIKEYDRTLVAEIKKRWWGLLQYETPTGIVVLEFELHSDGSVLNTQVLKSTVPKRYTAVCEQAVSTPFAPFPEDMRRIVGPTRKVTFTFNYY